MGALIFSQQVLSGELGRGVGRLRLRRHRLMLRDRRIVSVDGGRRRKDDLLDASGQGGGEHAAGTLGVELGAFGRLGDGLRDRDHGGKMVDLGGACGGLPQDGLVEDRAAQKATGQALQVTFVAAAQVVEDCDFGLAHEMPDQVGADKSRAASDEDTLTHARSTHACMAGSWASMDSTSLNWVRARSRLWVGRVILK